MQLSTSTAMATYRYLRIGIAGAAVALGATVAVVYASSGPVTSISALFYTSGRTVFTGALLAIALGLLALSGHSVEQIVLDIAALFAAIIAAVPTPVAAGDVAGLDPGCPGPASCVPLAELPGVRTTVVTLAAVGLAVIVLAVFVARMEHTLTRGTIIALVVATGTCVGMLVWVLAAPRTMLGIAHVAATGTFFLLMIAAAIVSAATATGWARLVYAGVAIGMAACLVYLAVIFALRAGGVDLAGTPLVLIGEAGLVGLFAVFWIAQTVHKWDDADAAVVPAAGIAEPEAR